jgi:hypothetical protein
MRSVLEELLLRARVTDEKRLRKANDVVLETDCKLAHALVKLGLISDRAMAALIAQTLNLRVVDPMRLDVHPNALAALAGTRAYHLRALPIRLRATANGEFLYVAMSDPTDQDAVRELEATTGREIVPAVAEEKALERALRKYYGAEKLAPAKSNTVDPEERVPMPGELGGVEPEESEPPLVVGAVLEEAAHLLVPSLDDDDGGYFSESTEELVTVYSRARVKAGADDDDMAWLAQKQHEAGAAPKPAEAAAPPPSASPTPSVHRQASPAQADEHTLPIPRVEPPDDPTRETSVTPAMKRAVRLQSAEDDFDSPKTSVDEGAPASMEGGEAKLRAPTVIIVEDKRKRAWLRAQLRPHLARVHMEESVALARDIGRRAPMGYVVVVEPRPSPTISGELSGLKEMAGSPKVLVVGGEAAFQIVPGVDAWIEAPDLMELPDAIVKVLRQYDSIA